MTLSARGLVALVLGAGVVGAWAPAASADRHPYRLALAVNWGPGEGSDAFRLDTGRALAESLAGGCFAAVDVAESDAATTDADLVLAVVLSDVEDQTRFDDSIATALEPGEPSKELRRVAYFEVSVDAVLRSTGGAVAHSKHLVAAISRRPLMVGEDPQAVARAMAIERIVSDLTKTFCRGGDKLERKIRAALAAPNDNPAPAR